MNNIDIDDNSQNIKIKSPITDQKNKNENTNQDAYPTFKNQIKQLFNEFENEEGQNLNAPSVPAINFSEKDLDLLEGCCALCIFLLILLVCIILIIVFIAVGGKCLFVLPIPGLVLLSV